MRFEELKIGERFTLPYTIGEAEVYRSFNGSGVKVSDTTYRYTYVLRPVGQTYSAIGKIAPTMEVERRK